MDKLGAVPISIGESPYRIPQVEHVFVRRGSGCPRCGEGILDFNGLLDLECDRCGYSLVEGAGCS